jgi:molecular chaperone GrpE (heat shock protein)
VVPVILILGLLLLIFVVTFLLGKRKASNKNEAPVSKPISQEPELQIPNSDLEGNISYQTQSIKNLQNDVSNLMKSINDMNDTFMTLKTNLDQKDEEISRYKNGYDATIFKNFLLRFARVDRVIREYSDDNKIDLNGLKDIQIQMDDALSECDVEVFYPEIGYNFKSTVGVADNPEIVKTSDKSKDSTIAEILRPGYRRKLANNTDNDYQIIITAKVAIYVYN